MIVMPEWQLAPQTKPNFQLSPSARQCQNPHSGSPTVEQDLNTCHDWPVKEAIV